MGRVARFVCLLLLLVPATCIAWQWRAMPHLGAWHDDAVYCVSAKSLATGNGYRLLNLPGAPPQTKYPPLYPVVLSLVWRIAPEFPQNLPWLMALQWTMLAALIPLLWMWFRQIGLSAQTALLPTAVVALCPMTTMFATTPLTELPFLITVLATMLLAANPKRAFLAGLCAAAAVLIRTNGVALALAVPIAMLFARAPRRRIATFLAPVLLAFAGWELWSFLVRVPAATDIAAYYTDYTGFYRSTFSLTDFPRRVWINADGLLTSIGRLILWSTSDSTMYRQLCWAISIFAFTGWIRLFRRGHRVPVLFASMLSAMLLAWNFPADQRFAFPLLPFALAGLASHIGEMIARIRVEWTTSRAAASLTAACLASFAVAVACLDIAAYRVTLPAWIEAEKTRAAAARSAYQWIDRNTEPTDVIAAYDDPLLYLFTGRRATSVAIMPALVYEGSDSRVGAYVRNTVREWHATGVEYVLTTPYDFSREFQAPAREAQLAELRAEWQPVPLAPQTIWKRVAQRSARAHSPRSF